MNKKDLLQFAQIFGFIAFMIILIFGAAAFINESGERDRYSTIGVSTVYDSSGEVIHECESTEPSFYDSATYIRCVTDLEEREYYLYTTTYDVVFQEYTE